MSQSLSYTPADASIVSVTNWAEIKRTRYAEQIGSATDRAQRHMAFRTLFTGIPALHLQGMWSILTMLPPSDPPSMDYFKTWGWDASDLVWEAGVVLSDGETVRVLRLGDDADLQAIADGFQSQGYEQSEYGGAQMFFDLQDRPTSWLTGVDQRNAALIADDHVLLHASSPEALRQVIDARSDTNQSWADLPAYRSLAPELEQMIRAEVISGQFLCARWSLEAWLEKAASDAPLRVELERLQGEGVPYQSLHAYEAFGMGYRIENDEVLGLIALRFANPEEAEADLKLRSQMLAEGNSLAMRAGVPYSRALFALDDAEAEGATINLRIRPQAASTLWGALQNADMSFGFCP